MGKTYVIDLEANGLLDEATKIHCMVASTLDGKKVVKLTPKNIHLLPKFLEEEVDEFIGHNIIGFDLPLIKKLFGYEFKGKVTDTLLMSRLYNPNRPAPYNAEDLAYAIRAPHGLYAWGVRVGIDKPDIDSWDVYTTEILNRCAEDVRINIAVYKELLEEKGQFNWGRATDLTMALFRNLQQQSENGWRMDVHFIHRTIHRLDRFINWLDRKVLPELPYVIKNEGEFKRVFLMDGSHPSYVVKYFEEELKDENFSIGGLFSKVSIRRVDTSSAKEIKEFLLSAGWIPEEWNINKKTGERTSPKISKTEEFKGVKGSAGKLLAKRIQTVHRKSNLEGWLKRVRPDGRIACNVSGMAETGRMKHRDVANVPKVSSYLGKAMRRCFIAEDGFTLVGCDSAGCQNRMLAARVGDDNFTNILIHGDKKKGTSIHQINAKAIKRVTGIDVTYDEAKTLNYAFMFGSSDGKLGSIINKSKEVGTQIREALLSVSPGFEALVSGLQAEWRRSAKRRKNKWGKTEYYDGYVTGLDGRPIFISAEHTILVYVLQSDEAIMMSAAYCLLNKRLSSKYTLGKDYRVVCFYHDEYTVECRKEIAEDVAEIAEKCIVDAGKFYKIKCPHEGDSNIGESWYAIH